MKTRAWIEVDLEAVRRNVCAAQRWVGENARVMAVVKADAYGHGLLPVARAALEAGAAWLGVAAVEEGIALREAGVLAPICLLCAFGQGEAGGLIEHALTPLVGDAVSLDALIRARSASSAIQSQDTRRFAIHLDVDTGIGRSGVQPAEAVGLWQRAVRAGVDVSGVSTHFADADNEESLLTPQQERAFDCACTELTEAGARFEWVHAANSPAMLRRCVQAANLMRPGLLLYGIGSAPYALAPALALKATVATVRDLPAGHGISYGATHRLTRPSRIATVLIGYGDGYPRRLSNQGHMLIRGHRVPILGRVCMDQTVVDVTDTPIVIPGDEAVCIGVQGGKRITIEDIAAQIATTPHEITTCLTARLPRYYV